MIGTLCVVVAALAIAIIGREVVAPMTGSSEIPKSERRG
jgi:hypothetical protein